MVGILIKHEWIKTMSKLICPRCNELGNAKHIDSHGECERCTLNDIQTKSEAEKTTLVSKE